MNKPFEKWSELIKTGQEPFQALAELNLKVLQEFTYLKPEVLTTLKKPEDLFEKQISIAIENGHKALDYMQKSFHIMEKATLSFMQETKTKTQENL